MAVSRKSARRADIWTDDSTTAADATPADGKGMPRPDSPFAVGDRFLSSDRGLFWYALQVRPCREFRAGEQLAGIGIEAYIPTQGGKPLFPGYVLLRCELARRAEILELSSATQLLPTNHEPSPIPDEQIEAVRAVLAQPAGSPCAYVAGERVAIKSGPLTGVSGVIVRTGERSRVLVGIEMLHRAVPVEIDAADVEKL